MRIPPVPAFMRQEPVRLWRQYPDGSFHGPFEARRCRVDRSARLAPNDYQLTAGCSARVIVDATELSGGIAEGDLVEFDGERHAVSSVSRIDHPDGSPHHWEADVI